MSHLIETYALSCGVKIDKPFIYTKFFPLPFDKFITFHPNSKYQAKCYDYWQDVLDVISPILSQRGIAIVQIGTKEDKRFNGVYHLNGQTTVNQAAYLVSNSILHLGADSFATHVASGFGKKIVCLYSNNFINCVKPYWTKSEDMILLEPNRGDSKPSFSAQENPKTINGIKPEKIVESVLKLLDIDYKSKYSTLLTGSHYINRIFETVPDQVISPATFGVDSLIVRMDYLFNEQALAAQLQHFKSSVVTNKPIDLQLLNHFRGNIREVVYEVDLNSDIKFIESVASMGLNYFIITRLSEKDLNKIKIKYFELNQINNAPQISEANKKIINNSGQIYYKSNKFTLSDGKIYPSKYAWKNKLEIDSFEAVNKFVDDPILWEDAESFRFLLQNS